MKIKQMGILVLTAALLTGCAGAAKSSAMRAAPADSGKASGQTSSVSVPAQAEQTPGALVASSAVESTPEPGVPSEGSEPKEESGPREEDGPSEESRPSEATPGAKTNPAQAELTGLLNAMEEELDLNAPEGDEKTVQAAASLLNWGVGTELSAEQVRQTTLDWLINKGDAQGADINRKFARVDKVYQELLGENGAKILSDAHVENAAYPWSDEPIETVEEMMKAVGLR